jgi:hypothetical protein
VREELLGDQEPHLVEEERTLLDLEVEEQSLPDPVVGVRNHRLEELVGYCSIEAEKQ